MSKQEEERGKSWREEKYKTNSIDTRSLVRMAPSVVAPPQPMPLRALAAMKLSMLCAIPHQTMETRVKAEQMMNSGLRPTASDRRPNRGWKVVEVSRNDVDSQVAELAASKWDVMTGWDEAMMVPSKEAMKRLMRIRELQSQNRFGSVSDRKVTSPEEARGGSSSSRPRSRCPRSGALSDMGCCRSSSSKSPVPSTASSAVSAASTRTRMANELAISSILSGSAVVGHASRPVVGIPGPDDDLGSASASPWDGDLCAVMADCLLPLCFWEGEENQ